MINSNLQPRQQVLASHMFLWQRHARVGFMESIPQTISAGNDNSGSAVFKNEELDESKTFGGHHLVQ